MNELEKIELKKRIWQNGNYIIMQDSLIGQEINLDFQSIDLGFYQRINNLVEKAKKKRANVNRFFNDKKILVENRFMADLKQGNKISIGSV